MSVSEKQPIFTVFQHSGCGRQKRVPSAGARIAMALRSCPGYSAGSHLMLQPKCPVSRPGRCRPPSGCTRPTARQVGFVQGWPSPVAATSTPITLLSVRNGTPAMLLIGLLRASGSNSRHRCAASVVLDQQRLAAQERPALQRRVLVVGHVPADRVPACRHVPLSVP